MTAAAVSRGRRLGQYAAVTVSQWLGMGAAFAITLLLASALDPTRFGTYSFVIAVVGWLGVFSELGWFTATSRLVAREDNVEAQRRLLGAGAVIAVGIWVLFALVVIAAAFVAEPVFGIPAKTALLLAAPLSGGVALELSVVFLCQGSGRHSLLVFRNLVARPLALVLVAVLVVADAITVPLATTSYFVAAAVASIGVLAGLRPSFELMRSSVAAIRAEARAAHDRGIFIGRAVGASTYNLDRILIAYFLVPRELAYYALAFALTTPIVLGSQSIGWLSFRGLVGERSIPRALFQLNAAWLLVSAAVGYFAIHVVIDNVLPDYRPALDILVPVLLTAVMMGALQLPNQFLFAHGQGQVLRNIGIVFGAANLVLNVLLIPLFGLQGAAYGSLAGAAVSLVAHVLSYRRVLARNG